MQDARLSLQVLGASCTGLHIAQGDPDPFLPSISIQLGMDLHKKHKRTEFIRVHLSEDRTQAFLTGNQSSAWLSSIAQADTLIKIPGDVHFYPKGERLSALLLPT